MNYETQALNHCNKKCECGNFFANVQYLDIPIVGETYNAYCVAGHKTEFSGWYMEDVFEEFEAARA